MSKLLRTNLILTVFNRAAATCQFSLGLLVHADCGSQYTSDAFITPLDRTQAIASLSQPDNPYDNTLAESGYRVRRALLTWKRRSLN